MTLPSVINDRLMFFASYFITDNVFFLMTLPSVINDRLMFFASYFITDNVLPLMTLPSVINDRLMFFASSNLSPVDSVCFARSLRTTINRVIHIGKLLLKICTRF